MTIEESFMVVPLIGRSVAAVAGALLVLTAGASVIGTLIVPRQVSSWLTRWADRVVDWAFRMATSAIADYRRRDRVLAAQTAAILLAQLAAWLGISFIGYALLLWPFEAAGITSAFTSAGSAMFTLGFAVPAGPVPSAIVFAAAATGLVIITLQIAYLPTLYAAFNRRETEVALLNARAGVPSWGPELLARTHYALGSGVSTIDTLPDLYTRWERWAADVAESHTTYLPLVRFRSPRPLSSWVTALLAVLDSAALFLALSPKSAPVIPARLCLRGGFLVLQPDRAGDGHRGARRARPKRRNQPELPGVPRRDRPDARGRLPDRARPCRCMGGFRRLAAQLRAGCLCRCRRRRRRAGALVGPAPAPHSRHGPHPPAARTTAQVGRVRRLRGRQRTSSTRAA